MQLRCKECLKTVNDPEEMRCCKDCSERPPPTTTPPLPTHHPDDAREGHALFV